MRRLEVEVDFHSGGWYDYSLRGAVESCISPANSRVPLDLRLFSGSFLFPFFFDVPCR